VETYPVDKRKVLKILDAMPGELDIQELIDKLVALKKADAQEPKQAQQQGGSDQTQARKSSPYLS
jgi:hypothetical protein